MLFTLSQLIEGREPPVCASHNMTVKEALTIMIENNFSQLPVVNDDGELLGIVSDDVFMRMYFRLDGKEVLSNLTVDRCRVPAETLPPDYDLTQALEQLKRQDAVVVVVERKPVGIVTHYDTTEFFREYSAGLILVQDIELTLREFIENALPNEQSLTAAMFHAFGPDRRDSQKPAQTYPEMTLREHVQLISVDKNWPKFGSMLSPKPVFTGLMQPVVDIRNQIAHFRGQVTNVEMDTLRQALNWLNNCPRPAYSAAAKLQVVEPLPAQSRPVTSQNDRVWTGANASRFNKYDPLHIWLSQRDEGETDIKVTFTDIEKLLGEVLPPTAFDHRSWWANDSVGHRQSIAWLTAGWKVMDIDFVAQEVTFRRVETKEDSIEGEL